MMDSSSGKDNDARLKCVLLLLIALLFAHLVYGWKYLQPNPVPVPPPAAPMPPEPDYFDWHALEARLNHELDDDGVVVNPFLVSFEFQSGAGEGADAQEETGGDGDVVTKDEPPPPPPPPPRVLSIKYTGTYVSMTGKVFALVDIYDSKSGKSETMHLHDQKNIADVVRIAEITDEYIDLVAPDETPVRIEFSKQAEITVPDDDN